MPSAREEAVVFSSVALRGRNSLQVLCGRAHVFESVSTVVPRRVRLISKRLGGTVVAEEVVMAMAMAGTAGRWQWLWLGGGSGSGGGDGSGGSSDQSTIQNM